MAKAILAIFGGLSVFAGIAIIVAGFATSRGDGLLAVLGVGAGLLVAGAPLLGFAHALGLLERIERNTRPEKLDKNHKERG